MSIHSIKNTQQSNMSLSKNIYILYNQSLLSRDKIIRFIEKTPFFVVSDTGLVSDINNYTFKLSNVPAHYSQPRRGVMIDNVEIL